MRKTCDWRKNMNKLKNSLFALAGLASLAIVTPLLMPLIGLGSNAIGGNTAANQTQNVNVVNSPMVTAQQSGTWNVGINGTPTVGIDGANNTVKIDGGVPVPVRDVDNPARQPFQANFQIFLADGNFYGFQDISIPANKRLVIEFFSATADVAQGDFPEIDVRTVTGNVISGHFITSSRQGTINNFDQYVVGQTVRLYADPGTQVKIDFSRTMSQGIALFGGTISGYFVDIP